MPLENGVKKLVLYLEEWQKQMIKDFLGADCNTYEIDIPTVPHPVLRYAIPTSDQYKRMYFTDWQMREIRDEAGVECEFVELHRNMPMPMYMVRTS